MTQLQIEERKQYLEAVQNAQNRLSQYPPLKKITDDLERKLNLGFLPNDNAVAVQQPPLVPKKRFKVIRRVTTALRKLRCKTFSPTFHTIGSRMRILKTNHSWSTATVLCFCFLTHSISNKSRIADG